ncbi:MAG: FtsW/RodA/SpoVE family cell cycle protein [Alphaproteobacteria bacterium]|jgi:cell division protein FtsW|nr:FtsW/RodA/SpoVE family cell cycle protein [Alphaproteobacteria bacterium]
MTGVARTDPTILGRWWWTVDRWSVGALLILITFGAILIAAASPAVAGRLSLPEFHFVYRHLLWLVPAIGILFVTSLLTPVMVRRLSVAVFTLGLAGVVATLLVGAEIKGSTRWLHLAGQSLQPSEFVKPAFAVVAAWLFAQQRLRDDFPGNAISILLFGLVIALLLMQPDLGMAVVVAAIWGVQFFLSGLSLGLVLLLAAAAIGSMVASYHAFDHVASRIDRFLDPESGDTYQVQRAMEAFSHGGVWGTGPGEGTVKDHVPDAHADFIFAVAGEEFGLVWCLVLVGLFAFIVLRGFYRIAADSDMFVVLAASGLLALFGVQALVNMGSALHLIPTKGMTLPFVSYGGSSLLALAYGMGMMLALTRRRPGAGGLR